MIENWEKEIYAAHMVRQRLGEVDKKGLWGPHKFPEVAASAECLLQTEVTLREKLDPQYRAFLSRADGWKGFYQCVDLFGTQELKGGAHMEKAKALLKSVEPLEPLCGVPSSELLPIAVSRNDIDFFAIGRSASVKSGQVFWFAGGLIQSFEDFSEFFLAMIDYNRCEIEAFEKMF